MCVRFVSIKPLALYVLWLNNAPKVKLITNDNKGDALNLRSVAEVLVPSGAITERGKFCTVIYNHTAICTAVERCTQ